MSDVKLDWTRIDSELYRAESPLGSVEIIKCKDGHGQPVWRALGPDGLSCDARLLDEAKQDAERELADLIKDKPALDAHRELEARQVQNWPRYELVFRFLPHPSKQRRARGETMWDYYEWKLKAYPQFREQNIREAFTSMAGLRLNMPAEQRARLDLLVAQAEQEQPATEETEVSDNIKQRPEVWLGKPPREDDARDAIHIAVLPAVADGDFPPGARVGVVRKENGEYHASRLLKAVGIVDPFLREPVKVGSKVWVLLFPYTITSLRHEWTHPAIDGEQAVSKETP